MPEAPSAPESMKEAGLSLAFLNDLILRTLYSRGGMLGLDLARIAVPALQGHRGIAQVPQGRKVHRGRRRRSDRPRQLSLQPHRAGPPPRPGIDQAMRLRRPRPGADRGLHRADLSPGGHRHRLQPRAASGGLHPPGDPRRAVQRHRPGHRQRQVGVHLRPARQRQNLDRPRHRRFHEQRRRRSLRPLRLPGREQHHHALRSVHPPCRRQRRQRPHRGQRGHHSPPAQHRHRGPALGAHPSARRRHRRRAQPGDARSALQRGRQLLPGAAARQGQRRRLPDRRLRPPTVQSQGTCSIAGFCRSKIATTS